MGLSWLKQVEKSTGEHGRWELQNFQESGNYNLSDREATTHNFRMVEEAAKMLGIAPEVSLWLGLLTFSMYL